MVGDQNGFTNRCRRLLELAFPNNKNLSFQAYESLDRQKTDKIKGY
jgi:hypothetical protein